jgi:hypothetical protein
MAAKVAVADSIEFVIDRQGNTRHILDEDNSMAYEPLGDIEDIYRSSHVETWHSLSLNAKQCILGNKMQRMWHSVPTAFWADLTPVGGPVLGPFASRKAALAAEVDKLKELGLPLPAPKRKRLKTIVADKRHYKERPRVKHKPNQFRWHFSPALYMILAGTVLVVIILSVRLVEFFST